MPSDRDLLDTLNKADEAGQVAYTRQLCEAILYRQPGHGPTLVRYARVLIESALYDEAAVILDQAESVVPVDKRHLILEQRGHRFELMGNFSAAEELHMKAHDLVPNDATYLIYAASAAFRRGDIHRAEELARKAILCRDGCLDEAYSNLGGYLLVQKRYSEARECYLRAIEIDSEYTIAKERLADVELVISREGEKG
jgi:tetratricopeptide (TPR) repeat protein